MTTLVEQIKRYQPCEEAKDWLSTQIDIASAWKNCERGDWMLWYLSKIGADKSKITLCACEIARLALKYTTDPRVEQCIVITEKYANGDPTVTLDDVFAARKAAYAAFAAYAAYVASAAAASASAAYVADAVADVAASVAAATAAYTAADAYAAADAHAAARKETLKQCADIVREHFPKVN